MTILYFPPMNKLGNKAFRKLCLNRGADYVFTEMIKVEQLLENDEIQVKKATIPEEMQTKTIVQIICEDIENIEQGVKKILEINPNTFEINYNMGCPQSTLCKNEAGGGILKNLKKVEIVAKRLAKICKEHNVKPSIKTRIGLTRNDINIFENIANIKRVGISKIYLHGRVLREPYSKPATYDEIGEVKKQFKELEIIGNGDIKDTNSYNKILKTNCNGYLIGRASLENPNIFYELKNNIKTRNTDKGIDLKNRKELILEYLSYAKEYGLNDSYIKSNLAYLTKNCVGGADLRRELNNICDVDEIINVCEKI